MTIRYDGAPMIMHRSFASHNPYNPLILTIDYSKNFTTVYWQTIEHMAMFVVHIHKET